MGEKILNVPFRCDLGVGHMRNATMKSIRSLLLCPDRSGLDSRVALRIWEVKYIGPLEGIDKDTDGEGGGQACSWGD